MKTILSFTDSDIDKRKVILRHDSDVRIFKEVRKDHIEWIDGDGNPIEKREYIVIRFPKNKGIDPHKLKVKPEDKWRYGFQMNDLGQEIEMLFYDRITFAWIAYDLEEIGLFKVTQQIIPDNERDLFPFYINASNWKEYSYNTLLLLFQLVVKLCRRGKKYILLRMGCEKKGGNA